MHEYFDKESIPEIRGLAKQCRDKHGRSFEPLRLANGLATSGRGVDVAQLADARDFLRLFDLPGLIKYAHDHDHKQLGRDLEKGDDLAAAQIEAMLSKVESSMLITTGQHYGDDVVGAVPNVGAYLAGNPMNMRNKRNEKNARGPLSLFLETTTSAAFEGHHKILRMAAMVAMARAIAIRRPLNLWFNITYGGEGKLIQSAVQVETSPLDLSRLAALCANLGHVNTLGREACFRDGAGRYMDRTGKAYGSWAYNIPELERTYAGEILGRVISPGSQIAYLPAGLMGEDDISKPDKWIEGMLRKYAPYMLEGVDREDIETDATAWHG